MATIPTLTADFGQSKGALDKFFQENASLAKKVLGPIKRPDPPRGLRVQPGSLEVLVLWNAPQQSSDIVGWRVYRDSENNLVDVLKDGAVRSSRVKVSANTSTAFYVSSVNARGRESIKVGIIGKANNDKFVVNGTAGESSGTVAPVPAEYSQEPTGGAPPKVT